MQALRENKFSQNSSGDQRINGGTHDQNDLVKRQNEPVNVYCRLRPLQCEPDLTCAQVINSRTLVLKPPEQAVMGKATVQRGMQYIFKHIFEADAKQREVFNSVAEPLVENLLQGRNSLLFTYGVTGSGKTFTMTGDGRQPGIMPRCLGLLFRAINEYQAPKHVFKPDKLNGFEILSDADALLERQAEMHQRFENGSGRRRKDYDPELASQSICEANMPLCGIEEDNMYAVFVTYVEVYNNSVYDLLDMNSKNLQCKIVREDINHNMFVHGVTEMEVKSVEEALDAFYMGQRRKRMAHTALNAESSRSHSVFTIRLVQAPTDCQGEEVIQDKRCITVSQLSLVDLAGSERSSRTKNTGVRLREAGNINNSLMTLRTCLEYLRENQQVPMGGTLKKIPYRDAKITHLFKNYFEGEGQVSMIVCINPRVEDYDENSQVLKFAEMAQEVQVTRPVSNYKQDIGLTPGRRKANKILKIAQRNMGHDDGNGKLDVDVGIVYSFDPGFPEYNIDSPECETIICNLMEYLALRIEKRKLLCSNLCNRFDNFRTQLMDMEKENLTLRTELASMKAVHKLERDRMQMLENKIRLQESSLSVLNTKLASRERQIDDLTRKLNAKQKMLSQKEQESEKQKKKFTQKLAVEVNKNHKELETRLREQRAKLEDDLRLQDEKLRLVANIIHANEIPNILSAGTRTKSVENLSNEPKKQTNAATYTTASSRRDIYATPHHNRRVVASNIRHRRSRSTDEKWIEHRAPNPVPLGTILQPYLKNRKSVTKLPEMKDLTDNRATKYCLISQDADTEGEVETKLYKGNVIPTCGGGAQVVFNDVEHLKQTSPLTSPRRKRKSNVDEEHANPMTVSSDIPPSSKSEKYF